MKADGFGYRRFLYEDPHCKAMDFMVPTESPAFADQAPGGRYWRHAPVVRFSETPCESSKPYLGLGSHTVPVLRELGYASDAIARLKEAKVIAIPDEANQGVAAN